jgi:putative ABC transport system ATP-binding protein
MLKAVGLSKQVQTADQSLQILNDVNFEAEKGQTIAIVGASGSGKSTLLGLLAGLDQASSGEVWLGDVDLCQLDEDGRAAVRKELVGFIFQNFQLISGFTALENVMMPLELLGVNQPQEKATFYLKQVGLGERLHHYPLQMSGGEQQRVAIARAFASEPKILFADEPTGNLDHNTSLMIEELLFSMNRKSNTTLVLVTHDIKLANKCDRILNITDGKLEEVSHA